MSQIVHITFEKLTGLKGEIEGVFKHEFGKVDNSLPLIYEGGCIFRQGEVYIYLDPINKFFFHSYNEHFKYGTNFLIKSWIYGGGVKINSQPPN